MKIWRKFFCLFIGLLWCVRVFSQYTQHQIIQVGYKYKNFSQLDLGYKFLFLKNDNYLYRMGVNLDLGYCQKQINVDPFFSGDFLFNFSQPQSLEKPSYYLLGAEIGMNDITPKAGISLFGIIDLGVLHSISFNNKTTSSWGVFLTINTPIQVFSGKK